MASPNPSPNPNQAHLVARAKGGDTRELRCHLEPRLVRVRVGVGVGVGVRVRVRAGVWVRVRLRVRVRVRVRARVRVSRLEPRLVGARHVGLGHDARDGLVS